MNRSSSKGTRCSVQVGYIKFAFHLQWEKLHLSFTWTSSSRTRGKRAQLLHPTFKCTQFPLIQEQGISTTYMNPTVCARVKSEQILATTRFRCFPLQNDVTLGRARDWSLCPWPISDWTPDERCSSISWASDSHRLVRSRCSFSWDLPAEPPQYYRNAAEMSGTSTSTW